MLSEAFARIATVATVHQKRMRFVLRHIQHRGAIHVDPQIVQLICDMAIAQGHGLRALSRRQPHEIQRRHPFLGQGGTQSLHATALLIDQNRRIRPDRLSQVRVQCPDLTDIRQIAIEQDKAPRLRLTDEIPLPRSQNRAGYAHDESCFHRFCTGMHCNPRAASAAHAARVSVAEP